MRPPKVVFDTNIFISAIIFGGNPRACLELAREEKIELYVSSSLLLELSQKLEHKFDWTSEEIMEVIVGISVFAKMIRPNCEVKIIKNDPTDNKILEIAKEVNADYIVSGDKKHILSLKKFGKTKIISAADFLEVN